DVCSSDLNRHGGRRRQRGEDDEGEEQPELRAEDSHVNALLSRTDNLTPLSWRRQPLGPGTHMAFLPGQEARHVRTAHVWRNSPAVRFSSAIGGSNPCRGTPAAADSL